MPSRKCSVLRRDCTPFEPPSVDLYPWPSIFLSLSLLKANLPQQDIPAKKMYRDRRPSIVGELFDEKRENAPSEKITPCNGTETTSAFTRLQNWTDQHLYGLTCMHPMAELQAKFVIAKICDNLCWFQMQFQSIAKNYFRMWSSVEFWRAADELQRYVIRNLMWQSIRYGLLPTVTSNNVSNLSLSFLEMTRVSWPLIANRSKTTSDS